MMFNFSKRSRSPNHSRTKEVLADEFMYILHILCKELHLENYDEIIRKVKDMKDALKKSSKEKKLI